MAKASEKPKSTAAKKSAKTNKKPGQKKITITLNEELAQQMDSYLKEYGYSKEEFIKKAIGEKISRDKISGMIDTMIR